MEVTFIRYHNTRTVNEKYIYIIKKKLKSNCMEYHIITSERNG